MQRRPIMFAVGAATLLAASLATAAPASAHSKPAPNPGPTVVASGLNNPRQITLVGNRLLIAETGKGGDQCAGEGEDAMCIGLTGTVSAVAGPASRHPSAAKDIVTGLLSAAGPDGTFAGGASGVGARSLSAIYSAQTFAPPEALPPNTPGADQLGKLLKSSFFRGPKAVANLSAYEAANDPDGQGFDSNPYSVLVQKGRVLVADAAANAVLAVDSRGRITTFHVFPTITTGECGQPRDNNGDGAVNDADHNEDGRFSCDPVPTSLAQGKDGSVYVGGLSAEAPGEGRVYKLSRNGKLLKTWTGFTDVTGVDVDKKGNLYVSQLFAGCDPADQTCVPGLLTKVSGSKRVDVRVPFPAGVQVDHSGNVFVAAWSIASDAGAFGIPDSSGAVWRYSQAAFKA